MSGELTKQILKHNFDKFTPVHQLLSFFDSSKSLNHIESKVYLQHWCTKILEQKLIQSIDEFNQILTSLIQHNQIITSFHCSSVHHELLLKLLNVLTGDQYNPDTSSDNSTDLEFFQKSALIILSQELNNPKSLLWKTFLKSKNDQIHCICNSIKCLKKILLFINKECQKINFEIFDELLDVILESYHQQIQSSRCFAYEFLKFCSFLINFDQISNLKYPRVLNRLTNWIYSNILLESYRDYFRQARDFGGNVLHLQINLSSRLATEFRYDCPLIRCYVILVLKFISIQPVSKIEDSYEFFRKHLNLLKSRIIFEKQIEQDSIFNSSFPIEWLTEVFLPEDSELFEMLHQVLLLYGTSDVILDQTDHLIHRLFRHFISESIHEDSSVLLEMLCTDQETATMFLQFLVAYLKILPLQHTKPITRHNMRPRLLDPVIKTLIELRIKIQKLQNKNLFPYNPKPLLRLLNGL